MDTRLMERMRSRWADVCMEDGILHPGDIVNGFKALDDAYSGATRFYHSWAHIEHGLSILDCVLGVRGRLAITMAFFWHDVASTEKESAERAVAYLRSVGVTNEARIAEVARLVLVTDHLSLPVDSDASVISGMDLAILGAPRKTFIRYDDNIGLEYKDVPRPFFHERRAGILEDRFLKRPRIYVHPWFYRKYEAVARENLEWAIAHHRALAKGK